MKTNYKNCIANGLFLLLENNDLNNITVTKLVQTINISRTTFYNNFNNINDVLNYKLDLIIEDLYNIYYLNKIRKNNKQELLKQILIYVNSKKNIFRVIKTKIYFDFKNKLDISFISKKTDLISYIKKSGIIINVILYYLDNSMALDTLINKIKID